MRRILILAAVLSVVVALPAQAVEVGARGIYWFPDISGTARTFDPVVGGTEFNIKDDLGVGDENFLSGEAFIRGGRVHFRVGYTPVKFDGNKRLSRQLVFGDQTFNVNDDVISRLDLKMVDADLQVDLLRPDLGVANVNIGVILKVKYVDGEVDLRTSGTGVAETEDFRAPIPMIGLAAGVGVLKNMLRADVRAAGIGYSGNHLFEGDAFVTFSPLPFFGVQGGYRIIDLKIDEDDDIVASLKLKGPYVGARLSF